MKMLSLTVSLSACFLFLAALVTQGHPANARWWFQSTPWQRVVQTIQPKPASSLAVTPTPTHAMPSDPRQMQHAPCPPCGMG